MGISRFSEKGIEITIEEFDEGAEKIFEALEYMEEGPFVKVGVLESAGEHKLEGDEKEAKTVAEIADIHEYGREYESRGVTIVIPERSFIRSTMNDIEEDLTEKTKGIFDKVLDGAMAPRDGLTVLGLEIQKNIKAKFTSNDWEELSDARKRAKIRAGKSGNKPLIDTGQLRNSINFEVHDEDDEGEHEGHE